ncbi:MAG: glycosyltransferase [Candidatus Dormibacteria bacterium]
MPDTPDRDVPAATAEPAADLQRQLLQVERELRQAREEVRRQRGVIDGQADEIGALRASDLGSEVARLSDDLIAQQQLLMQAYQTMREKDEDVQAWRDSAAIQFASAIQHGTARLAPPGTARQRAVHRAARAAVELARGGHAALRRVGAGRSGRRSANLARRVQAEYERWREIHEPRAEDLRRMRQDSRLWSARPLISIIMPTFDPEIDWMRAAVASVTEQTYESWELCIADDASTKPEVRGLLDQLAQTDARIKVVRRQQNGGIAAASSSALRLASGDFVALLDHDDILSPHALHRVVEHLHDEPGTDVLYSDEDIVFADGRRGGPHFKPDWSPDLLLSVNYMCHLLVVRRDLVEQAGGFRQGFDGAQDHDLALRVTETAQRIGHIADVLYSWRQAAGSVAADPRAKMYAYEAGRRAVESALDRRGQRGSVSLGQQLGTYHVRRTLSDGPEVAIVIPTRDRVGLLRDCLTSIESLSTYRRWSITIIDNGSIEPESRDFFAQTAHSVVPRPGPFNYSELMNFGRSLVDAPYLIMLNNDVVTTTADWIEALLEHAQRPEVGAVGARLVYPGGRTQHEGVGLGNICEAATAVNLDAGWMGRVVRDVSAVTGACQMVRTAVFDEVGGYDPALPLAYNDVDFCLRVRASGRLVVYTPHAELCHRESATRGGMHHLTDEELFWRRWGREGGILDPYVSPHLRSLNPLQLRLGSLPTDR